MPGVILRTATRSGPAAVTVPTSGRYFVAGMIGRGPTDTAYRVRSVADLERLYGPAVSYGSLYDDVRMFFEEGGAEAYVLRVVGPAAVKATKTLMDKAGTPLATLAIDAIGEGTAGNAITVQSAAGTLAGTFKLIIVAPGTGGGTETFDNLTTITDALNAINGDGTSRVPGSSYVRARDLASVSAAPLNQPAVLAATALLTGADDTASVTAATITTALSAKVGPELGAGIVGVPGYPYSTTAAALKAYAIATRRIAITATAVGQTKAQAITAAASLVAADGDGIGIAWPWVRIPTAGGSTKLVSPEGYIAAQRARAHAGYGPHRAPAGDISVARFVTGPEVSMTGQDAQDLDDGQVNAIRTVASTTRLYGWRSLSTDFANYALLTGRDVVNTVAADLSDQLEPYVFRTIDSKGQLLAEVAATIKGRLELLKRVNALYPMVDANGNETDAGYSIDVGPNVNTLAVFAANTIAAIVALRVSPVGTKIDVTIVKAALSATV